MNPFQAVKENNFEKVEKYTKIKGVNLNLLDETGKSLLDYAILRGYFDIAKLLRKKGGKETNNISSRLLEALNTGRKLGTVPTRVYRQLPIAVRRRNHQSTQARQNRGQGRNL